jgi:hypothetical protein
MKLSSAAVLAILVVSSTPVSAQFPIPPSPPPEQTGIHCRDFRQLSNGAWTPIRRVTLLAPQGPFTVEPGESFGIETGGHLFNLRIARILNDQCR